jgi:glutamine cyclotransferase
MIGNSRRLDDLAPGCKQVLDSVDTSKMKLRFISSAVRLGKSFAQKVFSGTYEDKLEPEKFEIVHVFPHDPNAYTQGLAYHKGVLYESTGINGKSSLRKVDLETGEILQKLDLAAEFFGEGITLFRNKIIQLTWRSRLGFIYALDDFRLIGQFSYPGEGWGLTTDQESIYMSDGTADIRILDATNFVEKRRIRVHHERSPISLLNALEYVDGQIFANVWRKDKIVRISPENGTVLGWIDLSGLPAPPRREQSRAFSNGIAYDAEKKRLFVTGKLWPHMFEVKLSAWQDNL